MKIPRIDYDPATALTFYEESLSALGALCERTWHDRLQAVAEGRAATLWKEDGSLHAQELLFAAAEASTAREPDREVFPGCPLTFRLTELLRTAPLVLEKVILPGGSHAQLPHESVLEKLWLAQYPATRAWRRASEPKPAFHFSLVALVRCEIQAIDQHWSLHRVALSLPNGEADQALAREIPLIEVDASGENMPSWPVADPARWWPLLRNQIAAEIDPDLQLMRARQEQYLQREIQRIDEYFEQYEKELLQRRSRPSAGAKVKTEDRLAAARSEHARRRLDQVARHEVRVQSHIDALLLVAEPAWEILCGTGEHRSAETEPALFVPRARRWFRAG